ncbi:MAG TPA: transporter substrate-binding domain-containing protein [Burkholderiales bacterium]|jgi:polar amino acid transport system substrate-binding protein
MIKRPLASLLCAALFATTLLTGCASTSGAPAAQASAAVRQILAPSGKLRVAVYVGSPTSVIPGATPEATRGVGYELGRELARRLGVPFEPVIFPKNADSLASIKEGRTDVTFTNATPARARDMDFSQPFLDVERGFLVGPGSNAQRSEELDHPGARIGASIGSTTEATLNRQFKNMKIVLAPTLKAGVEMLAKNEIDAFATNKAILYEMSDSLPGSRVLAGQWGFEHFAAGIPHGRQAGEAFVRQFIEQVKADGSVARAARRGGVRGIVVPK